jgi:hypothetical protein
LVEQMSPVKWELESQSYMLLALEAVTKPKVYTFERLGSFLVSREPGSSDVSAGHLTHVCARKS